LQSSAKDDCRYCGKSSSMIDCVNRRGFS
jgi:hypothetical protein